MSAYKSNTIGLKYGSIENYTYFDVLSFEDDDVELIKLNKKLLNRNNIEKFIGHRKKYRIRFNKLTTAQIDFLYNFVRNSNQQINFNSDGGTGNINSYDNYVENIFPSLYQVGDVITASGVSGSGTIIGFVDGSITKVSFDGDLAQATNVAININRTLSVKLLDDELAVELFGGFIEAPSFILEFEDNLITSVATTNPAFRNTIETSSGSYREVNKKGISILLAYNYGNGQIRRNFNVNLAESYGLQIERDDFEYIDRNKDRKNYGFYQLYNIEFGNFGGQSQISKQDDIEWIREFCLAPTKQIYFSSLPDSVDGVICDFDEIAYELVGSIVYSKSLGLRFISKNLLTTNLTISDTWDALGLDNWEEETTNLWDTWGS